jgi:hypothetical protein
MAVSVVVSVPNGCNGPGVDQQTVGKQPSGSFGRAGEFSKAEPATTSRRAFKKSAWSGREAKEAVFP